MDQPTITALQQENQHLQQRVAELEREAVIARCLYANFPAGFVFVFDHDLRYLEANGRAVARSGLYRDNLVGRTIWEALPADTVTRVEPIYRAALAGNETLLNIPFADGIFELHVLPVRDDRDKIVAGMVIAHDITAHQQLEQQFQQSQAMLQLVIDNLPQAVFWKDCDLIYQGCNQTFATFAGVGTPAQIVGKSDYDLPWKPEEATAYRQYDQQVMERGEPEYHIIETQQHADGKQSWADTNKIPLRDADGAVIGILGTYEDITERKQQEAELRRYAAIIEQTSDGISTADAEGNVLMLNLAFRRMLGLGMNDDISAYQITDFHPNWVLQLVRSEGISAAMRDGVWSGETAILNIAAGAEIPVSQVIIAHQTADDSLDFLSTIVRDLSERKRQEAELRTFQTLVEHAPDGITIVGLDGILSYANPAFRELLGYGEETIGMHMMQVRPDEGHAEVAEIIRQLHKYGVWRGRQVYQRKDGSILTAQVAAFMIYDEQGQTRALMGIHRDITEQERQLQEHEALQHQLIEAQQTAIRELSSPLLPLTDTVVALPLIGSIDSNRAQQITETLLEGIAQQGATIALVDITGVSMVDTQVAHTLVQAARAVRLLGAQMILTGIKPEIAQTIIHLGVELDGIITYSTLQAGIAAVLYPANGTVKP
jgi:rsbT co-antagonist protein RsbR